MGLGGENEPPKKKLKQAQLSFTPRSQKRKLTLDEDNDDDVQFVKIIRKDFENQNDKENIIDNVDVPLDREKNHPEVQEEQSKESVEEKKMDSANDSLCQSSLNSSSPVTKNEVSLENTVDFSLSVSDSVLEDINRSNNESHDNRRKTLQDEMDSTNVSEYGADGDTEENKESEWNRSFNSEDDKDVTVLSSSNEDTPERKLKPLTPGRKLTPKRLESIKKKEERERQKQERRAERAKLKEEKLKKIEEEKKKRRDEKEKKRLEEQRQKELKEEERKKKEEERKLKEEEKKKKEEDRRLKDEEKRKRDEAKEEEKRKKEEMGIKEKAAFAKFFKITKLAESQGKIEEPLVNNNFMPFPVKPDMKLAPVLRKILSDEEKENLTTVVKEGKESETYLKGLKNSSYVVGKSEATWPLSSLQEDHDVIIIESNTDGECVDLTNEKRNTCSRQNKLKAKLLQFHDNRRPPYWGTWRKKSKDVQPRRPLGQDKGVLDYEVDSDSEWEDEGEGEDLDKEEGDSEGEESNDVEEGADENGYLLDNTFVPHGYLSDEEVHPDDEIEDNDPENQKIRMKLLKQEFDEEMKSKTERLKPRLLGFVWISNDTTEVSSGSLYESLLSYRAVWNEEGPIEVMGPEVEDSPTSTPQPKKQFPQAVLESLAKYVHGNNLPLSSIIKEFLIILEKEHSTEHVSKRAVTLKIKEIASKTYDYITGRPLWSVNETLVQKYGLKPLHEKVPPPVPSATPVVEKPKESPLMNYFNKGVPTPVVKKRVPLISMPSSSFDYTPSKMTEKGVNNFGTPRPVDPPLKKRATLITLSTTSGKTFSNTTPRVDEPKEPNSIKSTPEVINLCDESN